mmetsp:Transcript_113922/g.302731  ORF Transcript_113922/g.302731 Transcript_113922/m.302731 type:complete len:210 (-) Transcript_113922:22-651(-)
MGCRWGREDEPEAAGEGGGAPVSAAQADPEDRALFLGLDRAGKTAILRRLFCESAVDGYQPTQGVNTKSNVAGDPPTAFMAVEVGGQQSMRPHWLHFLDRAHGLVYVTDASDASTAEESSAELGKLLQDPKLAGVPVLLFVNKIDLAPVDSEPALALLTGLRSQMDFAAKAGRKYQVQPCSAKTGEGLQEGMDWLRVQIRTSRAARSSA